MKCDTGTLSGGDQGSPGQRAEWGREATSDPGQGEVLGRGLGRCPMGLAVSVPAPKLPGDRAGEGSQQGAQGVRTPPPRG